MAKRKNTPFTPAKGSIEQTNSAYDMNATYGRRPENPDIGTFEEWLANEGITGRLRGKRKDRLQQQYEYEKGTPFALTDGGAIAAKQNPDAYFTYLMGEAGGMQGEVPIYGGPTRFGNWLANDYKQHLMDGYDATFIQTGGDLGFRDYMASAGYGAQGNQGALLKPPGDTGNPFTSSSLPSLAGSPASSPTPKAPEPPSWNAFLSDQGVNKPFGQLNKGRKGRLRDAFGQLQSDAPAAPTVPTVPKLPAIGPSSTGGIDAARRQYRSMTPQQRGTNGATSMKAGRWSIFAALLSVGLQVLMATGVA